MHEDLLHDDGRYFTFNSHYDIMNNFPRYIPMSEPEQEKDFGHEDESWLLGFL